MRKDYNIRVLERTNELLKCFTGTEVEKSLSEVAKETGLHKSTAFRILETLESMRWLDHNPKTGLYRLGIKLFEIGNTVLSKFDFFEISRPYMDKLVKETGQSVHLVIHDSGEALYLNKMESSVDYIIQGSRIGIRMPMHCTAVGKVLLAYMGQEKVDLIIKEKGLHRKTEKTTTTREKLLQELSDIKKKGYAVDDQEIQDGIRCVAAPLCDYSGHVIAAISVSGFASNFNEEKIDLHVRKLLEASTKISQEMGCNNCRIMSNREGLPESFDL